MEVAAAAARRFPVARQMLAPVRSLGGGPDGVLDVFRRLGSIQFDPLAVAGRNHDASSRQTTRYTNETSKGRLQRGENRRYRPAEAGHGNPD